MLNSAVTLNACLPAALWHIHNVKIRLTSSLCMHECWSNPYGTFHKAFLQRLCHLCHKGRPPGELCLHYNVVDHLSNHAMMKLQTGGSAEEWCRTYCVHGCCRAALVGTGQSQGRGHGGDKEGGAGQDHRTSRPEHLPSVQGLDRSESPNHWLSVVELELGEDPQLEERKIKMNVWSQSLLCEFVNLFMNCTWESVGQEIKRVVR